MRVGKNLRSWFSRKSRHKNHMEMNGKYSDGYPSCLCLRVGIPKCKPNSELYIKSPGILQLHYPDMSVCPTNREKQPARRLHTRGALTMQQARAGKECKSLPPPQAHLPCHPAGCGKHTMEAN